MRNPGIAGAEGPKHDVLGRCGARLEHTPRLVQGRHQLGLPRPGEPLQDPLHLGGGQPVEAGKGGPSFEVSVSVALRRSSEEERRVSSPFRANPWRIRLRYPGSISSAWAMVLALSRCPCASS